jgi:nucleoside-diphosphate-sugar epimerase
MTRYTILGGSGFVGSNIKRILNNSGIECYVPRRDEKDIYNADLGRVFYCVGLTADYINRPFDTVEAHVSLLSKILEKASFERLIYLSSTRLYDTVTAETCAESIGLSLNPNNTRHIYDLSKALGESLCLTAAPNRTAIARLSCVYDHSAGSPGFLSEILQKLAFSKKFSLDSATGYSRDYIAIEDVIASLKVIIDSNRCEIFNVASGENLTNREIIETLNSLGCTISLARESAAQVTGRCDISKIKSLGISPIPLRDYLKNFLRGEYES